ncbi:hypothetical protein AVEN_212702-1, partial [Araneus ventricosus]
MCARALLVRLGWRYVCTTHYFTQLIVFIQDFVSNGLSDKIQTCSPSKDPPCTWDWCPSNVLPLVWRGSMRSAGL